MATDAFFICEKNHLVPADIMSLEAMQGMKEGEHVRATITRPRNLGHHRKFFVLMGVIFDQQDRYPTPEHLLDAVKIGVGHYDLVPLTKKQTVIKTRSISFASMDQAAFEKFYDRVVKLIVTRILPGVDSADLERQVLDIIGSDA